MSFLKGAPDAPVTAPAVMSPEVSPQSAMSKLYFGTNPTSDATPHQSLASKLYFGDRSVGGDPHYLAKQETDRRAAELKLAVEQQKLAAQKAIDDHKKLLEDEADRQTQRQDTALKVLGVGGSTNNKDTIELIRNNPNVKVTPGQAATPDIQGPEAVMGGALDANMAPVPGTAVSIGREVMPGKPATPDTATYAGTPEEQKQIANTESMAKEAEKSGHPLASMFASMIRGSNGKPEVLDTIAKALDDFKNPKDQKPTKDTIVLNGKAVDVLIYPSSPGSKPVVTDLMGNPVAGELKHYEKPSAATTVNFGGSTNPTTGKEEPNAMVQMIGDYKMPAPNPRTSSPAAMASYQKLMDEVKKYNPEYDGTQFANRNKTRQAFTTGSQGKEVVALNTAIAHIDQMSDAAEKLGNGDFTPSNEGYQWFQQTFGADAPTNFAALQNFVAGEVAKSLSGGQPTQSEIEHQRQNVGRYSSPKQLAGYMNTVIPVLGSKAANLDHQYHVAMGEKDPWTALFPDSKDILKRRGFDPDHPSTIKTKQLKAKNAAGDVLLSDDGGKTWHK